MKTQDLKPPQGLQHEGKMSMQERIAQSQAYGEQYRANQSGPDQREAVKPLHRKKSDSQLRELRMETLKATSEYQQLNKQKDEQTDSIHRKPS
jgi:hypothetical protein